MNPLSERIPTGSRLLDKVYNVIDGFIVAFLLVAFLLIGRRSKDWGPRQ